jgi:hypothetical protein
MELEAIRLALELKVQDRILRRPGDRLGETGELADEIKKGGPRREGQALGFVEDTVDAKPHADLRRTRLDIDLRRIPGGRHFQELGEPSAGVGQRVQRL